MITCMRTTVVLDEDVFRRAKAAAAAAGVPLSRLLEDALREHLRSHQRQERARAKRFRMLVFGEKERRVAHEPADFAAASEAEDRRRLGR